MSKKSSKNKYVEFIGDYENKISRYKPMEDLLEPQSEVIFHYDEETINKGGRPRGYTKRTINRYKKVYKVYTFLRKKYSSKTKTELYELAALENYDSKVYSRKTIRNIIEDKKYNLNSSR